MSPALPALPHSETSPLLPQTAEDRAFAVQVIFCLNNLLDRITATAPLTSALGLCAILGYGPAASGVLISAFSVALGPFSLLLMRWLLPWQQARSRFVVLVAYVVAAIGALGSGILGDLKHSPTENPTLRYVALISLRVIGGVASGAAGGWVLRIMAQKVTTDAAMTGMQIAVNNAAMVGIAVGPVFSAIVCAIIPPANAAEEFGFPLMVAGGLFLVLCFAARRYLPTEIQDQKASSTAPPEEVPEAGAAEAVLYASPVSSEQKSIWWAAVMYDLERGFIVGALEAATSYIYEVEYGWSRQFSGVIVGTAFLTGLPLTFMLKGIQRWAELTDVALVRIIAIIALVSSCLIFPGVGKVLTGGQGWGDVVAILIADCLMFPSGFLGKSIMDSFGAQYTVPGSSYSQETLLTSQMMLSQTIGRFAGPPLARLVLSRGGRATYGLLQLASTGCGVFTVWKSTWAAQAIQEAKKEKEKV